MVRALLLRLRNWTLGQILVSGAIYLWYLPVKNFKNFSWGSSAGHRIIYKDGPQKLPP